MSGRAEFEPLVAEVTRWVAGKPLDAALEAALNAHFPPNSPTFRKIEAACCDGIAAGWMCERAAGGIKYGRVAKPSAALDGFSIDVVDMSDVKGPHHRHPNGEIDMIMPQSGKAEFDGQGAGWRVYGAGSAHVPTVAGGRALVLYLLPGGAIEFTKS
jgi:hypothetical protein